MKNGRTRRDLPGEACPGSTPGQRHEYTPDVNPANQADRGHAHCRYCGWAPKKKRVNAATTFRRDEIKLLHQIFMALLRGGDTAILVRRPEFRTLAKKVMHMKDTVGIE